MVRRSSWLAFVALLSVGCAETHAQDSEDEAVASGPASLADDGTVTLTEDARAFVRVEAVSVGADVGVLRAPARVAYREGSIARVGAPVAGRITETRVRIGDSVDVGAPLFVLRSPDAAATRAELAAARAQLETALVEARRTEQMLASGVGTDREHREAELHVSELEIAVARARTEVSIVGTGRGGEVTVRAPIAGVVVTRAAAIGMSVGPGDASLVEIADPSTLGVTADVFDRDAASVRIGAPVEFVLASSSTPLPGHVEFVSPTVTAGTRTVPVRVELDSPPIELRSGQFGRASISLVDHGLVLPTRAVLVRDGDHTIVYVELEPGRFAPRDVDVVPAGDGRVHVTSGLEPAERVVVDGALLLDGAADLLL